MDAYTGFAYVYDEYMDNIPYEDWGQYMIAFFLIIIVVPYKCGIFPVLSICILSKYIPKEMYCL